MSMSPSERLAGIILLLLIGAASLVIVEVVHNVAVHVWKVNTVSNPYLLSISARPVVAFAATQSRLLQTAASLLVVVLIALVLIEWRFVSRWTALLTGIAMFIAIIGWAAWTFYFMIGGYLAL